MNVFELFAKLSLNSSEYEKGLGDAENKANSFGDRFKSAIGTAAKVGAAAIAAVGTATIAIGKQALDAYADYEQLSGGIETLYGEHSAATETMMKNASQAWKTAGMSANEYMETAIQSSAALISSLGGDTEEAARLMDMSIVDMSDNVNKMGTTMEAVQNAYRGFSRGNFTMLDNLALGYAGTKEGMQQLLDKAKELEAQQGRTTEFSIESYSDIVQAIHIVQESMGIAGTTAKEANETISGSVSAMKSAWSNLLVGIADDNANITELVGQLVESITTVGQNIIPRVKVILDGAVKVITEVSKQILPMVVQVIVDNLPVLVEGAVQIVQTLGKAIIDSLPQLIDAGLQIILTLADALIESLPEMIPAIVGIVIAIVEKLTDPETVTKIVMAAQEIIIALANGLITAIPQLIEAIPKIISNLVAAIIANLPTILSAGVQILVAIVTGIMGALPQLIALAPEILLAFAGGIVKGIKTIVNCGKEIVEGFLKGIKDSWNGMVSNVKRFFTGFIDLIKNLFGIHSPSTVFANIGKYLIAGFTKGISEKVSDITDKIRSLKESISNIFQNLADAAGSWGRDLIGNFVDGLREKLQNLKNQAIAIAQEIKNVIGFSEPKEGPLSNFHTYAPDMMELFAKGITDNADLVNRAIGNSFDLRDQIGAGFSGGTVVRTGEASPVSGSARNLTVILQLNRTELGRVVHELGVEETQRWGANLAMGGGLA